MKNLVLGSLIAAVVSQAAGCIISSSDDDSGNDAFITANWQLKNIGAPIIDLFSCDDGTGTSAPLPPSKYVAWVTIADHNNTNQYATSTSALVDLTIQD